MKGIRHKYRVLALGTGRQQRHRRADQLLDVTDILHGLCRQVVLPALEQTILSGELRFERWIRAQHHVEVDFDDQPEAFTNLNTAEDLARFEAELQARLSIS